MTHAAPITVAAAWQIARNRPSSRPPAIQETALGDQIFLNAPALDLQV
ncbi:MAG: hypothetical protein WBQ08_05420 [Candidatus Sulfotelmatobacter sp.]